MDRRSTLRTIALCAVLSCALLLAAPGLARAADMPNIMIFLVDDMGVMDTSLPFLVDQEGEPKRYPLNDYYRTPSIERLAEGGVRFDQFYAMSVCSPSRVSIMTGQNAARHGTTNWIDPFENNAGEHGPPGWNWEGLQQGDVTLARLLQSAGYRTIHIGKAHFGAEHAEGADPRNLGFDINIAGASFGAPGSYYAEHDYGHGTRREHHAVPHLEAYHGSDTFLSEALTIEAKKTVSSAVSDGVPFFLHFSHYAVHSPFESDPRFAANYADSGKPANARAFATLVEGIDKSLGDMLDLLDELGVAPDTLVIFLGDNGTDAPLGNQHEVASAAPLRGKKGAHYEGGMRVPFIAAWAGAAENNPWQQRLPIAAGAIQGQVANVTDLFPTLLGLVDAEVPDAHILDGHPLDRLFTGKADPARPEQFLMHYPHGLHRSNYFTVWRDGDWKLIYHALPEIPTRGGFIQFEGGHYELFNLDEDPFEQVNRAGDEPEVLTRMVEGLRDALARHNALHPVGEDGEALKPPEPPID